MLIYEGFHILILCNYIGSHLNLGGVEKDKHL